MPEYDAFGREIGENTLAGLGGDSRSSSAPEAAEREARAAAARAAAEARVAAAPEAERAPAAELAPADPPAVFSPVDAGAEPAFTPPAFTAPRRMGRSLGCVFSLIVMTMVFGGVALVAVGIFGAARDAIDDVTDTFDGAVTLPDLDAPATPEPAPEGITGDSLIAPSNLAGVLGDLQQDGKRAQRVIVRPDRVAADLTAGRRSRLVQIASDGSVVRADPTSLPPDSPTVALGDLDPKAPARLVRRSAARFAVRPQGIDYLIASPDFTDRSAHHWVAYFKNGVYVEGDASGKVLRRID